MTSSHVSLPVLHGFPRSILVIVYVGWHELLSSLQHVLKLEAL